MASLKYLTMAEKGRTIGDRIRFLRASMKPVMTAHQLATRAGVSVDTIRILENNKRRSGNIRTSTLKKIAHAMDCNVFVNIRPRVRPQGSKPSRNTTEFPLEYHEAQPLPKRIHKASGAALTMALKSKRSYQKNYLRKRYLELQKANAEKSGSDASPQEQDE